MIISKIKLQTDNSPSEVQFSWEYWSTFTADTWLYEVGIM